MVGLLTSALLLTACSPVGAAQDAPPEPTAANEQAVHPVSGLDLAPVRVITSEGAHTFTTEFAISPAAQSRGLMFRETLADDEAMIFPYNPPRILSFWMKNTPISLDIVFIGPDRRIVNIETAVPYSLESVRSTSPAIAAFEIRGGLAQELGIAPGDKVEWEAP